jgi:hypothetical protein
LRYANAAHDLPYLWHGGDAEELGARVMPLGLMLGMSYEQEEMVLTTFDSPKLTFGESQPYAKSRNSLTSRRSATKGLLACLLALGGRVGTQPQRDVGGFHRLHYHSHEIVT